MRKKSEYHDTILYLHSKGMDPRGIAEKLGIKYDTAYGVIYKSGSLPHPKKKRHDIEDGPNGDRHKCRTCQYRSWGQLRSKGAGCEYILDTGHSRGCPVKDCDKYKKGPVMKCRIEPIVYGKVTK